MPVRPVLCALWLARIVVRIRPDIVVSTGAVGRRLAIRLARHTGPRTTLIDTIADVRARSISSRHARGVADCLLSLWPRVADPTGAEYRAAVI